MGIICLIYSCLYLGSCSVGNYLLTQLQHHTTLSYLALSPSFCASTHSIFQYFWYTGSYRQPCTADQSGTFISKKLKYATQHGGEFYLWLIIGGPKDAILFYGLYKFKCNVCLFLLLGFIYFTFGVRKSGLSH